MASMNCINFSNQINSAMMSDHFKYFTCTFTLCVQQILLNQIGYTDYIT